MQQLEKGQPNMRRGAQFIDQHGRRWDADIEMRTGHSIGSPRPMFTAPLVVPEKYVTHDPLDSLKILINYQRWIRDVDKSNTDWESNVRLAAQKLGAQGTISDLIANPPPELRDMVGPRPAVISKEVIQAAEAGNDWILTGEGEIPEQARQFFPDWGIKRETVLTAEGIAAFDPWAPPIEEYEEVS